MALYRLAELSYPAVRALPWQRTLIIVPVGATEAHGPHLPLGTDVIISSAMAERGGQKLVARGLSVLVAPPLSYTVADFAAGFSGTVSIRAETAVNLLVDICRNFASWGARAVLFANAHLEPNHIRSLRRAAERAEKEHALGVVFPDVTRKPWALRLTDEFKSGACHAGQYETSIVMAARPELVNDAVRETLPANPQSLSVAIGRGLSTFEAAGGENAYFGYPAQATVAEGEATIECLGQIVHDAAVEALPWVRSDA